jgi:hypothetical protein
MTLHSSEQDIQRPVQVISKRFQASLAAMQDSDEISDVEHIWGVIRTWLVISRVVVLILMVLLAEFTEEYFLLGISVSAWCIAIGIPLFVIISIIIVVGDKSRSIPKPVDEEKVLLNPIVKRH